MEVICTQKPVQLKDKMKLKSFGLKSIRTENFIGETSVRRKWKLRGIIFLAADKLKNEDEILSLLKQL